MLKELRVGPVLRLLGWQTGCTDNMCVLATLMDRDGSFFKAAES